MKKSDIRFLVITTVIGATCLALGIATAVVTGPTDYLSKWASWEQNFTWQQVAATEAICIGAAFLTIVAGLLWLVNDQPRNNHNHAS